MSEYETVDRPGISWGKRSESRIAALAETVGTGKALRFPGMDRNRLAGSVHAGLKKRGLRLCVRSEEGAVIAWCEPITDANGHPPTAP